MADPPPHVVAGRGIDGIINEDRLSLCNLCPSEALGYNAPRKAEMEYHNSHSTPFVAA
jgi:hypothetical protein